MNLMELFIKITADTSEVDKSIGDTKKKALSFGDVLKANIAGQAIVAGVKAVAGAVKNIGQAAIQSYAEYEQLVGGVETLFEDLSWDVGQNAAKAFQTAGLSANEYMSTAMSFAASLNQSLLKTDGNIARSADLTDQAIIDMADNANKMGTSMEMIQNAYQGFAKQNYTIKFIYSPAA